MSARSPSLYVENKFGTFRGVVYIAQIAQDNYTGMTLIGLLTDGDRVFEFQSTRYVIDRYIPKIVNGYVEDSEQKAIEIEISAIWKDKQEKIVNMFYNDYMKILESVK